MSTKIELQKQLLLAEKKISAETAALNALNKNRGKILNDIARIKSTIETADNKFKPGLTAKQSDLEKEAVAKSKEIELRNKNIAQFKTEISELQKSIDKAKENAEDDLFLYTQKVNALNDKFPLLLFPVRLETRFHKKDSIRELWIRVYPDTCQSEVPSQYLTAQELQSAIEYAKNNAYDLGGKHGGNRAAFIEQWVKKYIATPNFIKILTKGDRAEIKQKFLVDITDSIPTPQAFTLPDRFVFRMYNAEGKEARTEISKQVPKTVQMGFNGSNTEGAAWMHNFEEAVKIGLGIKITLTDAEFNAGFSKLVVLGVRTGSDVTQSQLLLENLIDNHTYTNKGFSLTKQGSITNNSDDEDTSYTWKNRWAQKEGTQPPPPPPPAPPKNTEEGSAAFADGLWLSQYLGINDAILQKTENAQGTDQQNARSMNTALFPATLGYFFSEMLDPVLTDDEIARVESFFNKYVTGRGTIPAIRIGKQPYGIMPVSVLPKLNLQATDPIRNQIVAKVQELFQFWKEKSQQVKHIGNDAPASQEDFLNILSLHPNSVEFHQRLLEDIGPKLNAVSSGLMSDAIMGDLNDWIEERYLQ
ncbi:MAG: hypothetical protein WCF67_22380, partial [Chitinophagaceae bacterium]